MLENKRIFNNDFGVYHLKVMTLREAIEKVQGYRDIDKVTGYELSYSDECEPDTLGVLQEKVIDSGLYLFLPIIFNNKYVEYKK